MKEHDPLRKYHSASRPGDEWFAGENQTQSEEPDSVEQHQNVSARHQNRFACGKVAVQSPSHWEHGSASRGIPPFRKALLNPVNPFEVGTIDVSDRRYRFPAFSPDEIGLGTNLLKGADRFHGKGEPDPVELLQMSEPILFLAVSAEELLIGLEDVFKKPVEAEVDGVPFEMILEVLGLAFSLLPPRRDDRHRPLDPEFIEHPSHRRKALRTEQDNVRHGRS